MFCCIFSFECVCVYVMYTENQLIQEISTSYLFSVSFFFFLLCIIIPSLSLSLTFQWVCGLLLLLLYSVSNSPTPPRRMPIKLPSTKFLHGITHSTHMEDFCVFFLEKIDTHVLCLFVRNAVGMGNMWFSWLISYGYSLNVLRIYHLSIVRW